MVGDCAAGDYLWLVREFRSLEEADANLKIRHYDCEIKERVCPSVLRVKRTRRYNDQAPVTFSQNGAQHAAPLQKTTRAEEIVGIEGGLQAAHRGSVGAVGAQNVRTEDIELALQRRRSELDLGGGGFGGARGECGG